MERFHSHGQHLYKGVGTKERVYIRKEFNSQDRHFPSSPSLCFKARLSATPLRWKWFFILVHVNFIFTSDNKVSALSFMAYLFGKPTWPTYHCFEHQYGHCDFMRKGFIETVMYLWVSGFHEAISSKGNFQSELLSFRCKMKSFRSIMKSIRCNQLFVSCS